MIKVYYATHNTGGYEEGAVVLFDDANERDRGLAESGYFVQIVTPEGQDGEPEGPNRA